MKMRLLAFALLVWSVFMFVSNIRDEQSGVTIVHMVGGRDPAPEVVNRVDDPEKFRHAMVYQWMFASAPLLLSVVLFGLIRRQDRLDPMSPNFAGNKALDELGEELDRERQRRKGP